MTVAAKSIRVSTDGSNWHALPGNQGGFNQSSGSVDDTVFGQPFKSMQPTSIDGKITANAFYKGFAGYVATLKKAGSTTATTGEATTHLSGQQYQITNVAKRLFDRLVAPTVLDGVTDVTDQVETYDYLFGIITFKVGYTVVGAITVNYSYLPLATIAKSNAFTLTQSADATETSDFETLQGNGGHKTYKQGLKTVSLDIKGFYDASVGLQAILESRGEVVIEINPDGQNKSSARGFFRPSEFDLSGNVGAIEESDFKFDLNVPSDDLMESPFKWLHTNSVLPQGLQIVLDSFLSGDSVYCQYLPDGDVTDGYQVDSAFLTEMSLAGGLDTINTFSVTLQTSGEVTVLT